MKNQTQSRYEDIHTIDVDLTMVKLQLSEMESGV